MPLTRWIVATSDNATSPVEDVIVNTLYFNVSGSIDDPNFTTLGNDLFTILANNCQWNNGRFLDLRGYNMDDAEPRPQRYRKTGSVTGTPNTGPHQVSLCLSYYADRNLPRQRGRIYCGPWTCSTPAATATQTGFVIALPPLLAGLGGVNVDWSIYSPKTGQHNAIKHAWVDNSWDIIRSRKQKSTSARLSWTGNG